ncbi:MAG: hypothetical protein QXI55_06440 [Thermofilum sp.]
MYGDVHKRLTELAVRALASSADGPAVRQLLARVKTLILASSAPDELPEYAYELDEELKARKVRVPHHTSPSSLILGKLVKVRAAVLRGRIGSGEVRELGYALHYLQDRCVPPPSFGELHSSVERRVRSALEKLLDSCPLEAVEVRGYRQLSRLVKSQRPASDPCLSVKCAATLTYAALYAVFANPVRAYPELMERAHAIKEQVRGWRGKVHAALSAATLVFNAVGLLALLPAGTPLIPAPALILALLLPFSAAACILVLIAAFARSRTTVLRMLYDATRAELLVPSGALSFLLFASPQTPPELLPFPAFLLLVEMLPLLSRDFREIRDEVPWFLWD